MFFDLFGGAVSEVLSKNSTRDFFFKLVAHVTSAGLCDRSRSNHASCGSSFWKAHVN